ncbi:phosphatidate cytidylyltransferase [Gloeobacter morelensis]|uniref:phosphatidate cytidylyltransferase n=1 Tax=Gloeobacter morelensis MG652769 TaxID=2781736 RepID=A0ABY3PIJ3_9CYAN|nr:phosphatidate cytidylyltransferase [Gloeobacter morelensis]UFP93439.1 phosphatidate cytidylyltransferase [Gloeobacter morelensis MG652769]
MSARILSASVLIPLVLLAIYLGGWFFTLALAVLVVLGQIEFFEIVRRKGYRPTQNLCLGLSLTLLAIQQLYPQLANGAFVLAGGLVCVSLLFRRQPPATISDMATSLLGLFYTGYLPSFLVQLRALDGLGYLLLLTFACIWASDIGAFFFGKAFGRTPLTPISPKKTVEGAIFGTTASILVGLAGAALLGWSLWPLTGIVFGLLVGVSGLLGDLTESLMKRDVGLKDAGNLIPGHGGILDRADSYIFTAPVAFYFIDFIVLGRLPLP